MKNAIKIGLNTWAIIAMIVGFFIFLGLSEVLGSMLWFCILYFVILMAFVSWGLFRVWKQRRKEREADLLRRVRQTLESPSFSDKPSPESILYLRPFQIDEQYMNEVEYAGRRFTSFESLVCQMVRDGGKPIAIGKPGEELQPLGAQRIYATDETWQAKVTEYFKVSKYVILYADFTPGVKWEIENAVDFYRDKLILIPKTYNRYGSFLQKISSTDLWLLFAPIYGLWVNRFFFKKAHRGRKYYRSWDKLLKKYMPGFKMNDTVSAVIFEGGRAIPFYAAKPTQEEQFRAIHRAIHAKLRVPTRPALYLYPGANPLLSLCADLGFKNITSATVYPLAMGRVEFYDRGLRYCSASSISKINRSLREENTFQKNYKSNQLIPYSSIRRVDQLGENLLQLVLDEANGSMYLFVPKYHRECIPTLKILLEQSSRRGYFTPDNGYLAHCRDKQESDYAKGLVVMEVFGLLLGGVLLLLSLLGVEDAYYLLFIGYGYWNLIAALLSYWLSFVSKKEFARIFGTVMLGIHVCLALHGFSMIF